MLSSVELGNRIAKQEHAELVPQLRVDLVNAQYDLRSADFPVIVLLCGDDQLAVRGVLRGMNEWMDGRYIESNVYQQPTDEESQRPLFWRYWRRLPRRGRIATFMNAWAADPFRHRLVDGGGKHRLARDIAHVRTFEQALVDDGALLIKLWFHLPKSEVKGRLKHLKKKKQDWRIAEKDLALFDSYDDVIELADRVLEETSTGPAPWHIIESTDRRYLGITAARTILQSLSRRLAATPAPPTTLPMGDVERPRTVLDRVDLTATFAKDEYDKRLNNAQAELRELSRKAADKGISSVLAFEGWDAGGKGGTIRRLTAAIDIHDFRVVAVAAPTEEESAHHYLWRFWNQAPAAGKTVIFDRTWYGRVLVERVEGFAREDEWRRAFAEIRDFEEQFTENGSVVLKFWLHIDPDEQLRRFEARKDTPFKAYKITDEDYRNRENWKLYESAIDEMVARTDTKDAPWHLVPANDKRVARVMVIETYVAALRKRLKKG